LIQKALAKFSLAKSGKRFGLVNGLPIEEKALDYFSVFIK